MLRNITEGLSRAKYWYSFGDVILRHNLFDFASEPLHASIHRIVLKHELSNNCVSVYNSSGSETFRSPLVSFKARQPDLRIDDGIWSKVHRISRVREEQRNDRETIIYALLTQSPSERSLTALPFTDLPKVSDISSMISFPKNDLKWACTQTWISKIIQLSPFKFNPLTLSIRLTKP